jgi:hypothetical protein
MLQFISVHAKCYILFPSTIQSQKDGDKQPLNAGLHSSLDHSSGTMRDITIRLYQVVHEL